MSFQALLPLIKNAAENLVKSDDKVNPIPSSILMITMGAIAFLFPWVMWFGHFVAAGRLTPLGSISEYYHTDMRNIFVGLLFVIGVLLIAYRGFAKIDAFVSTLAGIGCIGVALVPTGCAGEYSYCTELCAEWCEKNTPLHYISAAVFLGSLTVFCIFIFTMNNDGEWMRWNGYFPLYYSSGFVMILCLVGIYWYIDKKPPPDSLLHTVRPILVLETLSLWAFTCSWITKAVWIKNRNKEKAV